MFFRWSAIVLDTWLALRRAVGFAITRPFRFSDAWRALPGDVIGRAVMWRCGIPAPTREHDAGDVRAVLVEDPRIALWFRAQLLPVQAQTLGRYVLSRNPLAPDTLAHEVEHVRQWERFGPFYLPLYFGWSAVAALRGKRAYWDNGFEVAARVRADGESVALRRRANGTGEDETRPRT